MSKDLNWQIIEACYQGDLEQFKLLSEGMDVNKILSNSVGFRLKNSLPLRVASEMGHFELVKYLVSERGADVHPYSSYFNNSALFVAKTVEIANYLIDNNADVEGRINKYCYTPLQRACAHDNLEIARTLIAHKANVNALGEDENTLIHLCKPVNGNLMDYLISLGLDYQQPNKSVETPFYHACKSIEFYKVQYLAFKGIDVNAPNAVKGLTPKVVANQSLAAINPRPGDAVAEDYNSIIRFIDTWNRKDEFVDEVSELFDELNLSCIAFQFYCTGEVMAEPGE